MDVNVCNVVCGGSVDRPMPLDVISKFEGTSYDPRSFPGVRFRLNDCTVLLFGSGKVVVVGAASQADAFAAMDMLISILSHHNIHTHITYRRVCNVVATADYHIGLDLSVVVRRMHRALYEPEHFPGVIMRRLDPQCTILLFATGKIVCVGTDSARAASAAANQLYAELGEAGLV